MKIIFLGFLQLIFISLINCQPNIFSGSFGPSVNLSNNNIGNNITLTYERAINNKIVLGITYRETFLQKKGNKISTSDNGINYILHDNFNESPWGGFELQNTPINLSSLPDKQSIQEIGIKVLYNKEIKSIVYQIGISSQMGIFDESVIYKNIQGQFSDLTGPVFEGVFPIFLYEYYYDLGIGFRFNLLWEIKSHISHGIKLNFNHYFKSPNSILNLNYCIGFKF